METQIGKDKLLGEAMDAARKNNYTGLFLLPTGSGKGRLMVEIAKELDSRTITYLCNTRLLRDKMFKDELHKWGGAYLIPRIEFACYQTACKWSGRYRDLLLADEFDAALTPEYIKAITNNSFDKRILVSATLQEDKLRMAKKIAPIILERTLKEAIEEDILNNINFYLVNYNLTPIENGQYLSYNERFRTLLNEFKSKSVARQLEWVQINRKQFMSNLQSSAEVTKWVLNKLTPTGEKVIVFCGLSEQADRVCVNSFHSNNANITAFNAFDKGDIRHLSVVNKVDRGLNIHDIRNIIFENIGSSKTRLTQRIGRGLRLKPEEFLNVYLLVPHFFDKRGLRKPTIVEKWILESTKEMDLSRAKSINYDKEVDKEKRIINI